MPSTTISLPKALQAFVDEQAATGGYGSSGAYLSDLIRKEQSRLQLRKLLLAGSESALGAQADPDYFESLRQRVNQSA